MKKKLILTVLCSLICPTAIAKIYECTDKHGNHIYSETPNGKNCRLNNSTAGSFSTVPAYQAATKTSDLEEDDFYNNNKKPVDSSAVKTARKNLQDAEKALEEGKKIRLGNERNYVFYLKRIKGLEENVQARQKELNDALVNEN